MFIIRISFAHTTPKPQKGAKRVEEQNRRSGRGRRVKLAAVYLLAALAAALGWLNACLPDRVYLEPEQALVLPRFGWVEPLRLHGSQNVVSTRAVGSYQTTLALGGWLPVKTIRTVVTTRPSVTVCGTPFGVKMFSEGALIVGFSDVDRADGGTANPAIVYRYRDVFRKRAAAASISAATSAGVIVSVPITIHHFNPPNLRFLSAL